MMQRGVLQKPWPFRFTHQGFLVPPDARARQASVIDHHEAPSPPRPLDFLSSSQRRAAPSQSPRPRATSRRASGTSLHCELRRGRERGFLRLPQPSQLCSLRTHSYRRQSRLPLHRGAVIHRVRAMEASARRIQIACNAAGAVR